MKQVQRKSSKIDPGQAGFSLLEVLVALVVMSLGLLGLAALQATGLKNNYSAYTRSQAALYAYDMIDRLRADRQAALTGSYNLLLSAAAPSGSTLVDTERAGWLAQLAGLPGGDGSINVTTAGVVTIVVQWNDSRATAGSATASLQVVSQI
ncbi:MAG: type IV pilus modification protein PilV [Hydrogenophilaceae bacterium]|nr:type IV pilus modification protein PilV [Hydrogenophilaceae bacterium]